MPSKGRPRLTLEAYQARLQAYCDRYDVTPSASGLPPFPSGQRETPQHREWLSLYKAHSRLARRQQPRCERCTAPASEDSLFCEAHGGGPAQEPDASAATAAERRGMLKTQGGRCPICGDAITAADTGQQIHARVQSRSVVHGPCRRLVELAAAAGPQTLDRLRAYLWPLRPETPPRTKATSNAALPRRR